MPQRLNKSRRAEQRPIIRISIGQILDTRRGLESRLRYMLKNRTAGIGRGMTESKLLIRHDISHRRQHLRDLGNFNLVGLPATQIHNCNARM